MLVRKFLLGLILVGLMASVGHAKNHKPLQDGFGPLVTEYFVWAQGDDIGNAAPVIGHETKFFKLSNAHYFPFKNVADGNGKRYLFGLITRDSGIILTRTVKAKNPSENDTVVVTFTTTVDQITVASNPIFNVVVNLNVSGSRILKTVWSLDFDCWGPFPFNQPQTVYLPAGAFDVIDAKIEYAESFVGVYCTPAFP